MASHAPQVPQRLPRPTHQVGRPAGRGHPPSPRDGHLVALIVLLVGSGFLLPIVLAIVVLSAR
jgi:hypothetical protein